MSLKHKSIKLFKIYALIHENNVFIGKTTGEIMSVFYQHRRAENTYTAAYYHPKNSKTPETHILECISCSSREAYRHIVAWVRIFRDAGYQVLNPKGTLEDANDLYPQTESLITALHPISLDTLLKETQYRKQRKIATTTSLNAPEAKTSIKKKHKEKLTLWATAEEKEFFVSYSKCLKLTQTQTLQYLINKVQLEEADSLFPAWDNNIFIRNLQELHRQEIESKNKEIYALKTALRAYVEEEKSQEKKLKQCSTIVRKALMEAYNFFESATALPLDIERGRYKDYISKLPEDAKYTYPSLSDASLLRLQTFLLGEGPAPARFVLGIDCHGHRIILRYYPGNVYFWGISPGDKRFSQRNSVWYMAWKKTGDVAELVAAYPMQIEAKYKNPMDEKEALNEWVDKAAAESDAFDQNPL